MADKDTSNEAQILKDLQEKYSGLPLVPAKKVNDRRRKLFQSMHSAPGSMIALLKLFNNATGYMSYATAFLIDEDVLLTAAHTFYEKEGLFDRVLVRIGYDININPDTKAIEILNWECSEDFDLAVLILPKKMESYFLVTPEVEPPMLVGMAGYGDPDNKLSCTYGSGGATIIDNEIRYDINSAKGDSGAPIFIFDGNNYYAIGVHSGGVNGQNLNHAVLLSATVSDKIELLIECARRKHQ